MPTSLNSENTTSIVTSKKSNISGLTVFLLCFWFGMFGICGIHRFFLGKIGTGILMLITFGGLGIWTLIDLIIILCSKFKDENGDYLAFSLKAEPVYKQALFYLGLVLVVFGVVCFVYGSIQRM